MSKACIIKGDKKCEANVIEEIATKNDIESKVAMDKSMADECVEDSFTHVPETWAVATQSQCETKEMEGGSKGKVQDGVHNKEVEQSTEWDGDGQVGHVDPKDVLTTSIVEDKGCKAFTINEAATNNKVKGVKEVGVNITTRMDNEHGEIFSTLVPVTWPVASGN